MKFRLKILLGCHGNEDFDFKFYIFIVYNMRMSWRKRCLARTQMDKEKYIMCILARAYDIGHEADSRHISHLASIGRGNK